MTFLQTNIRMTFEGILYRMQQLVVRGVISEEFGRWNTVFKRFNFYGLKMVYLN